MPWLQLTLPVSQAEHPRFESALEDAGALSVTLADADAETPDEQAIFEPGVGETPLWQQMMLTALFEGDTDVELTQRKTSIKTLEWERIHETLAETGFNISETARRLGMHRRTLARKLDKQRVK